MSTPESSAGNSANDSAAPSGFDRWRGPLSTLLLIVFMVSAGLAVPAIWARNQVLDTDRFVRTMAPMGGEEAVQNAIANRVTAAISEGVADSNVVSSSDRTVAALVPMVTTAAVDSVTHAFVRSPEFPVIWEDTLRLAHGGFVALMNGGESEFFDSANGTVSVNLAPVVQGVLDQLSARGIDINPPTRDLTFVVFQSEDLADLQTYTKYLDELAIILPLIALAALIGYVLVAGNWRGAIVVAALGLAIMMVVDLLFLALMRWSYLRNLDPSVDKESVRQVFDTLVHYLRLGLHIVGLIALLVAGACWLAFRKGLTIEKEESESMSRYARWPMLGKFENAIAENRAVAIGAWAGLILALVLLRDWTDFGWPVVLLVVGVAGVILMRRARDIPDELLQRKSEPEPVESASPPVSQSLQQIADLRAQGLLDDHEFAKAKQMILTAS